MQTNLATRRIETLKGQQFQNKGICALVGVKTRALHKRVEDGLITPAFANTPGKGQTRLYSWENVIEIWIIECLLDAGLLLEEIRVCLDALRAYRVERPGFLERFLALSFDDPCYIVFCPEKARLERKQRPVKGGRGMATVVDRDFNFRLATKGYGFCEVINVQGVLAVFHKKVTE